jgi:D-3-phosphoglycerate dehydrogenase
VPPAVLDASSRCLVVSRYGVGVDNIPVARATELGILVVNVPDFCVDEVSDHAFALLLACTRRLVSFARSTHAGRWDRELGRDMTRLRTQTLGLVGYGKIARALARKATAFGMRVLVFTRSGTSDPPTTACSDLGELLANSDYVSLHVPATAQTTGMIGEQQLRAMKPSAYLINTARGSLIQEDRLVEALREGWIAGAALDVLSTEPPDPGSPLLALDNVIVTPHAAFYSLQSVAELQQRAAANVATVLTGELPLTIVNPAVRDRPNYRLGL